MKPAPTPEALLLIAPGCHHCPEVLNGLAVLLKRGLLGRLEVINIKAHPEAAVTAGTRSVPWLRLGPFELEGAVSARELEDWVRHAAVGTGFAAYFRQLLEQQRLHKVLSAVRERPATLLDLLDLIDDEETPMAVRLGIGALVEELQGNPLLQSAVPSLGALTMSNNPGTRADACHYLALSASPEAVDFVTRLLDDEREEVREIAAESLALLRESVSRRPEP